MTVTEDKTKGKHCLTEYTVLKSWKLKNQIYSLLEIDLHTGRTHQIRVTMASLAHPVAGDSIYHRKASKHSVQALCLVAKRLSFAHPILGGDLMNFEVEYPDPFKNFLQLLAQNGTEIGTEEDLG